MTSKYTPGPWVADIDNGDTPGHRMAALVRIGKDYWIKNGSIGGTSDDANARLMAAAPELLDALKALRAAVQLVPEMNNMKYDELGVQVNKAIAKAEGGL